MLGQEAEIATTYQYKQRHYALKTKQKTYRNTRNHLLEQHRDPKAPVQLSMLGLLAFPAKSLLMI